MIELIAGIAIALSWAAIFAVAWNISRTIELGRHVDEFGKESHDNGTDIYTRISSLKDHLRSLDNEVRCLKVNMDSLNQLSTAETGIYTMRTDKSTGKQTWVKAQDLEDQYLAQQPGRSADDVLEAAARMMSNGRA